MVIKPGAVVPSRFIIIRMDRGRGPTENIMDEKKKEWVTGKNLVAHHC